MKKKDNMDENSKKMGGLDRWIDEMEYGYKMEIIKEKSKKLDKIAKNLVCPLAMFNVYLFSIFWEKSVHL